MQNLKLRKSYPFFFLLLIVFSCVEEIDLKTVETFESALVVEATITNELKTQEVLLSRTYQLGVDGPVNESNATVKVIDENLVEYLFQETEPGKYHSVNEFAAQPILGYTISIITQEGKVYSSTSTLLTHSTQMDDLFFERGFNEEGEEGVSVFVNSFDPTSNSNFYRFKFEETYKIVAPSWVFEDLIIVNEDPIEFGFEERPIEELICYNTEVSNAIIITNTNNLQEDRLDKFRVLFINRNNFIITHRYSILVTQYVQSREAYTFYETLKDFSESESILSETQPGFLVGNLFSQSNSQEKVLGFFEVVSADTQRIYFNYEDLFPDEISPPYAVDCNDFFAPSDLPTPGGNIPLVDALAEGIWKYYQPNDDPVDDEGPYDLVVRPCGDCTFYGESNPPVWWEE